VRRSESAHWLLGRYSRREDLRTTRVTGKGAWLALRLSPGNTTSNRARLCEAARLVCLSAETSSREVRDARSRYPPVRAGNVWQRPRACFRTSSSGRSSISIQCRLVTHLRHQGVLWDVHLASNEQCRNRTPRLCRKSLQDVSLTALSAIRRKSEIQSACF
jgi:hypothetical protein